MILRMWCRHLILAFVLLAAAPAAAQESPPVSHMETVTITAGRPAIWHVTEDGGDVAILGFVQPLPYNFSWNTKPIEALLGSARRVLLPPQIRMGVVSGTWFFLTNNDLMHPPDGKTLWDVLDARVAADLARICDFLHEPHDRYNDNSPVLAAMRLGSDFRHVAYLTTHEPEDSIRSLAGAQHVPVDRIATYDLVPSAEEILKQPPTMTGKCVDAAIRDIEFQSKHVDAAAQAWATGDVAGMTANWSPSSAYDCLTALSPSAATFERRSIDDTVLAITNALADGGNSIALVDIGLLMRKDGVLDRLEAEGVSVAGPG